MIKVAYAPIYCHPLPEGHRFPMLKYELIPAQLLYTGYFEEDHFFSPEPASKQLITQIHDTAYFEALENLSLDPKMVRKIGFPISYELFLRECIICQGTVDACSYARKYGVAFNVAGGTHHAYAGSGEGFCIFNDVAIAAKQLLHNAQAQRILVIDLDVHQGNGTAKIFEQESRVFTFSMHGKDNYPMHKEKSDWDIALKTGTEDIEYLEILDSALKKFNAMLDIDFVFYISGVDVLASDKLGKLNLSPEGCKTRDELVFEFCKKRKLPVVVSMGGGYSPKIGDIVNAHCQTFISAKELYGY
jgi:acetoin utilization deacetylase AcuC-like enzyme